MNINDIPSDILINIINNVEIDDILNLSTTCKKFNNLIKFSDKKFYIYKPKIIDDSFWNKINYMNKCKFNIIFYIDLFFINFNSFYKTDIFTSKLSENINNNKFYINFNNLYIKNIYDFRFLYGIKIKNLSRISDLYNLIKINQIEILSNYKTLIDLDIIKNNESKNIIISYCKITNIYHNKNISYKNCIIV